MTDTLRWPSDQDASGRSLGDEEIARVTEALRSGTLTSTRGRFVRELETAFAAMLGLPHAVACSSGTAAMHAAVAALDPEPGEEIVTSPVTDMGAITPILYQGAIPVFADVDPASCNLTAGTIAPRLSERTRAIVVTHLFGNPCDMAPIMALASARGIAVIEDCAQAFLAQDAAAPVGTLGTIGVFSLQQGKHVTCGEGGLAVTADPAVARRMRNFINKAWDYGDSAPDHRFLALNYRMSELQGAVVLPQLARLPAMVQARGERAAQLSAALAPAPGLALPAARAGSVHAWWRYALRVDSQVLPGGPTALAEMLSDHGIASAPRYIRKPAFDCALFRDQRTFGTSRWPFTLARPDALDYSRERFEGVYAGLEQLVVLPWNERLSAAHVSQLADVLLTGVARMANPAR